MCLSVAVSSASSTGLAHSTVFNIFFLNDNMDVLIETFFYLHHTTAGTTQFLSQWVRVVYWVSQKVHLDFSIRCNGKSKGTFLSSDNIVVLKLPLFKSARYWVQRLNSVNEELPA